MIPDLPPVPAHRFALAAYAETAKPCHLVADFVPSSSINGMPCLTLSPPAAPTDSAVSSGVVIRTWTVNGKPWECRRYSLASGTVVFCHNIPA